MAMVINSNIQSLNAQRHLNNSLQAQNTATERLSSGLRINSAKDDAAGLAIANRMTSQVQGLNQAIRNANDGAALIQTAEGGLEEMTNILQRMRELSIQSANGTYDTGNRSTLNAEVGQLQLEIDRISETTSFNGLNILDGSLGSVGLQVGENANQTIAIDIGKLNTQNLGANGTDLMGTTGTAVGGSLLAGLITVTATAVAAADTSLVINGDKVQSLTGAVTLDEAVGLLNDSVAGITISHLVELDADSITGGNGALAGDDELILTINASNSTSATAQVINIRDTTDLDDLVNKINEQANGLLSATLNDKGQLSISSTQADNIVVSGNGNGLTAAGFQATRTQQAQLQFEITDTSIENINVTNGTGVLAVGAIGLNQQEDGKVTAGSSALAGTLAADQLLLNGVSVGAATAATAAAIAIAINKDSENNNVIASATTGGVLELIATDGNTIKIEAGSAAAAVGTTDEAKEDALTTLTGLQVSNEATVAAATVKSIDISTAEGAQRAIGILDNSIQQVSETRGDLGAISNRLDYTTRNLANISENAASAKSAIMDADFAAESANLSRAQVLQQAGNAMLAQANSRPQQVLSLLQ